MSPARTALDLPLALVVALTWWWHAVLEPRLAALRAAPQQGATAIEWVLITAVVVVVVGVVAVVIRDLVVSNARSITVDIPKG
ncbi:hypothetical protein [Pseudokineococcus sp. 1T1Z-3]|uniref:hypothetical protein n=1 Tax=Pseudokineococcus sp. 1T1Z-3 TaxID=3132745 RepID=UPI0030A65822